MPAGDVRAADAAGPSTAAAAALSEEEEQDHENEKGTSAPLTGQALVPPVLARAAASFSPRFFNANERNWHLQRNWTPLLYSRTDCEERCTTATTAGAARAAPDPPRATSEETAASLSQPSLIESFLFYCFTGVPPDGPHTTHRILVSVCDVACAPGCPRGPHQMCPDHAGKTCMYGRGHIECQQQRQHSLFVKFIDFLLVADVANLAATSRLIRDLIFPPRYVAARNCSSFPTARPYLATCQHPTFWFSLRGVSAAPSPPSTFFCYHALLNRPQAYMLREKAYGLLLWRTARGGPFVDTYSCSSTLLPDIAGNCVSSYRAALRHFILQQRQWLSSRPFFHESWQHFNLYAPDAAEGTKVEHTHARQMEVESLRSSVRQRVLKQHDARAEAMKQRRQLCECKPLKETTYNASGGRQFRAANCPSVGPHTTSGVHPAEPHKEVVCSNLKGFSAASGVSACARVAAIAARECSSREERREDLQESTSRRVGVVANGNDTDVATGFEKHYLSALSPGNSVSEISQCRDCEYSYADGSFLTAVACSRFPQAGQRPVFVSAISGSSNKQGSWCRLWTFPDELQIGVEPACPPVLLPALPPVCAAAQPHAIQGSIGTWWSPWMQFCPQMPVLLVIQQLQLQQPHIPSVSRDRIPVVAVSMYDFTAFLDACRARQREDADRGQHPHKPGLAAGEMTTKLTMIKSVFPGQRTKPSNTVWPVRTQLFSFNEMTDDSCPTQAAVRVPAAGIVDAAFSACSGNCPFGSDELRTMGRSRHLWEGRPKHLWALLASGSLLVMDTERLVPISKHTAEKGTVVPHFFLGENRVVGRRVLPFSSTDRCCGGTNSAGETSAALAVHEKALFFTDTRTPRMPLFADLRTEKGPRCPQFGGVATADASVIAADATGATVATLLDSPHAVRLWDVRGGSTLLAVPPLKGFYLLSRNKSCQLKTRLAYDTDSVLSSAGNSRMELRHYSARFAYFTAADAATAGSREVVTLTRCLKVPELPVSSTRCDHLQATVLRKAAVKVSRDSIFVVQQRRHHRDKAAPSVMVYDSGRAGVTDNPASLDVPKRDAVSFGFSQNNSQEAEPAGADGVIHQWRWGCSSPWRSFVLSSTANDLVTSDSRDLRPAGVFQSPCLPAHLIVTMQRAASVKIVRLSKHAACCPSTGPAGGEPPALWPLTT